MSFTIKDLENEVLTDLYKIAKDLQLTGYNRLSKKDLIASILTAQAKQEGLLFLEGVLEILPDSYGFLRTTKFIASPQDIYISTSQIKRFNLRTGDLVSGKVRLPKENERYFGMLQVISVNGFSPEIAAKRMHFNDLTPLFPSTQLILETSSDAISTRMTDLIAPVGLGQRGLIVSPPKAGKTILLKEIANSITTNFPNVELFILLLDERPEEVTDMERSVNAEVISSTFDKLPERHIKVSELVLERAQRLVEHQKDVVILLDSITRLARAYNLVIPSSGRTLSGGLDPAALHRPKRFFGAARNIEEGGSLTILATAMIDNGSRMDDVIYEEFKSTGNMELHLDRKLSERRIFPAIDIRRSGTRREEMLLSNQQLEKIWAMRRVMVNGTDYTETFIQQLKQTNSNEDFINSLQDPANNRRIIASVRS